MGQVLGAGAVAPPRVGVSVAGAPTHGLFFLMIQVDRAAMVLSSAPAGLCVVSHLLFVSGSQGLCFFSGQLAGLLPQFMWAVAHSEQGPYACDSSLEGSRLGPWCMLGIHWEPCQVDGEHPVPNVQPSSFPAATLLE